MLFEVLLHPTAQSGVGVVLVLLMDQTKIGVRYELKLWSLLQRLVWSLNSLKPCCYTEEFEFRSRQFECLLGILGIVGSR